MKNSNMKNINDEFYNKEIGNLVSEEDNNKLKIIYMIPTLILATVGYVFATTEIVDGGKFLDIETSTPTVALGKKPPVEKKPEVKKPKPKVQVKKSTKKVSLKKSNSNGKKSSGGGTPDARFTSKTVLSVLEGPIKNMSSAVADPFGKDGFATDLDALLAGTGGLAKGNNGAIGRKGIGGIGFGPGPQSGFGGPGGEVGDLLSGIGTARTVQGTNRRPRIVASAPSSIAGGAEATSRSKEAIRRVVMKRIGGLKYLYNKYLKQNPQLAGKITVKMVIAPSGAIIRATILESSLDLPVLEKAIVKRIKRWKFGRAPKGTATVVYPFNFSS